ncbi:MAG: cytochrome c [Pseudomonadota bacterium]
MASISLTRIAAVALAAGAAAAAAPVAADPLEDAVQARRGYFRMLALNTGPLAAMAKAETPYDAEAAAIHATNLALLGQMNLAHLIPEGTDNAAMPGKTRALPSTWSNLEDATAKYEAFTKASAALAEAAPNGLDALRSAMGALGQSCKSCHDDYRAKDF